MTDKIVGTKTVIPRQLVIEGVSKYTEGPLIVISYDREGDFYVASTHGGKKFRKLLKKAAEWLI